MDSFTGSYNRLIQQMFYSFGFKYIGFYCLDFRAKNVKLIQPDLICVYCN